MNFKIIHEELKSHMTQEHADETSSKSLTN